MKFAIKLVAAVRSAAWLAILVAPFCTALGQGSLTPVGPPAPTMKTLAQIEARTPISSAPFTISESGSYYLTNNLTVSSGDAITITASSVALDLNGFTISSTAADATGTGILISGGPKNLAIQNGFIQSGVTNNGGLYSGPGFFNGIHFDGPPPVNVRVTNMAVTGFRVSGIVVGFDSTVVESCTVQTAGVFGILGSTIKSCTAKDCGLGAIQGEQVSDSRGECSGDGAGIGASTVLNCYGTSNSSAGISAYTAKNCVGSSLSGRGITGLLAESCYGIGGEAGISTRTAQNCYGVASTGTGVYAERTALNCWGQSTSGVGVSTLTAQNCNGASNSSTGISADAVQNCRGSSETGTGISGTTVVNSTGFSNSFLGISAYVAENCFGSVLSGGTGLFAQASAHNCMGVGGYGIQLNGSKGIATNCHGVSTGNGVGITAKIAIGCYGESPNGPGIIVNIANSCFGVGVPIGVSASFRYNMP